MRAIGTLGLMLFLLLVYQVPVLYLLCRWTVQWREMRAVTGRIVAGELDAQVDHRGFFPDLREHATQLNELGQAIDQAAEERLKSDRFRAELITNVSHDLKTPLTSIVSYVDLLKKEELDSPAAREYVQVLERKSQQLKKLTEDLIEASKASTGAVTVSRQRLDLAQLARQAVGEYGPRLEQAGLSAVVSVPEQPLSISADGRHLGRVLDNLLSNCVKYALPGTRVYVDAAAAEGRAVLTVKNISRERMNVPPEQLMERFVRGDESRATEGSGLGLSIARSLTELQPGRFTLAIDGDLFKAAMEFPLLEEE
ncbi:MAG: HAMP domain-containing histidine kinase [Oscillospiraceae bacterium]|nr:HAMP domain-containing histidine kinase [Oscillospiraceae bacterium]